MISYLLNNEIDKQKYDTCISSALQSKVYAFSWYLDCVCSTWDLLILNDYEAVMPLPKKKKYGINYVFQPFWIQHLGIFSVKTLTEADLELFIKSIPKKIKLIDYNINFKTDSLPPKINYTLSLQDNYNKLLKNFSKGRKSNVTQGQKQEILVQEFQDYKPIIEVFKQNRGLNTNLSNPAYLQLETLIKTAKSLKKLKIMVAFSDKNKLLGGAFFIISNNRITYLFSAINQQGRDLQAMSLIINSVIKTYAQSDYILDFEGSMLPGVAAFFNSFGAQQESYYHLKKWQLF